ncbi:ATP-binding protein [Curtobacterium pusillum]|uniref:ATP-binding protein n=1 Tax=Curtobacterium pusillum TaxID=69373 RepID=UPI00382A7F8D
MELRNTYTTGSFRDAFPGESTEVEFKSGTGANPIGEAAVALSNTNGGVIFVGLDDNGHVAGRRLDQGMSEQLNQALLACHELGRYSILEVTVDDRRLVAIKVAKRAEGFAQTSNGRVLVRRGPRNHALLGTELFTFISSRALQRFESVPSELPIDQANADLLEEVGAARGWLPSDPHLPDRLRERGLAHGEMLTVAGALLLTRPGDTLELKKCVVEVRRYRGEGVNYDRRQVFDGPLQHQVRDASRYISDELGTDLIVSGVFRYDLPRLPEVVVREAVANAVAHRSYEQDRSATVVELRDDRVVVRSPGGLPEPVTVATMRAAQSARNPIIIEVLRSLSLAEDAGRGVDVMQDSMRDALLDAPAFEDSGSFVTVTLPLRGPITDRERGWISELERSFAVAPHERLIMIHAARGEALTNGAARDLLGTTDAAEARAVLQSLRDRGLLRQAGQRSAARYTLHPNLSTPAAYRLSQEELSEMVMAAARERDIVNSDVRAITGLTALETTKLLNQMVSSGRLLRSGVRRGARYSAVG